MSDETEKDAARSCAAGITCIRCGFNGYELSGMVGYSAPLSWKAHCPNCNESVWVSYDKIAWPHDPVSPKMVVR